MNTEEVGDRLYSLPPEQFVAARDAAVAEARTAGDRATAEAVGAMRKPTLAAWLVNLLALRRPELLDELFTLGEALRAAQRELRGEQLRELSGQRRGVVEALSAQARRLAREAGARHGDLPVAEVEATLDAALADAEVARQVRAGRLRRAASYTGFGETPKPQLRAVEGGEPAGKPAKRRTGRAPAVEREPPRAVEAVPRPSRAEADLAAARTRSAEAEAALEQATAAERDAAATVAELAAALDELRTRHSAAQAASTEAQVRRRRAQRDAQAAARQLSAAQQRLDRQKR